MAKSEQYKFKSCQNVESQQIGEHHFGEHFVVPVSDNIKQRKHSVLCELVTSMHISLGVLKKDTCSRGKKYMIQFSNPACGIFAHSTLYQTLHITNTRIEVLTCYGIAHNKKCMDLFPPRQTKIESIIKTFDAQVDIYYYYID